MAGIIGLVTAIFFPTGSYASISENFESAELGTPPAGWTFMENWGDSGTIKVHDSVGNNSSKSVRIVGKPSWAQGIYLPGSVIASDVQIAFDVYVESGGVPEYPSAYFIYNGVTLDLRPDGDTFVIMVDHSTVNQIGPFEAATWHRVNMSLDRADGTISLTIDQYELKNIAVTLDESGGWGSDISLYGDNNGNVASYFDNVSLDVITSGEKLEIIEANAKWEDNHDPMNAIDLDISVGYHSAGTHSFDRDPDMWWEADLGSVQPVSRISVFWQAVISWKEIEIRGSQDGITYSNLIGRTRVNTDGSWTNFDIAGDYRFLRLFYVGSGAGGEGLDLMEFEVYAVRDLDNGLVAYYPFDGNARDESGKHKWEGNVLVNMVAPEIEISPHTPLEILLNQTFLASAVLRNAGEEETGKVEVKLKCSPEFQLISPPSLLIESIPPGVQREVKWKLKGIKGREDLYRLRVGDYRIIYYENSKCIKVTQIIHRSKGYDWL